MTTSPPPDHALAGRWNVVELYCRDFDKARRYAAARDWWLHAWAWRTDEEAPDEPVEIWAADDGRT